MKEGIVILVPTLERPNRMQEFAESVDATTKDPLSVSIAFGVHEDDQPSINKALELKMTLKIEIDPVLIERRPDGVSFSDLWNQVYAKTSDPIVGFFGDDVIFRSPGWDEKVRDEITADKNAMVLCDDYYHRGAIATLFFTHRSVHDAFGYYMNPRFRRWFVDTWWDKIYRAAGKIHYHADIVAEHMHPERFPERADKQFKDSYPLRVGDSRLWETREVQQELDAAIKKFKEMCK